MIAMKKRISEWPLRKVQVKLALKRPCIICGFQINKGEFYFNPSRRGDCIHEKCGRKYDLSIIDKVHQL